MSSWANVYLRGAYNGEKNTSWVAAGEEKDALARTGAKTGARATAVRTPTLTGHMSYGAMLFYGFMLIIALIYAYVNMSRGIPPLFVAILAFYTISSLALFGANLGIETSLLLALIVYIGFLFR